MATLFDPLTLDIVVRLVLAALAGAGLGLERELRGRAAGLRTTMLACTAAALAIILAEIFTARSSGAGMSDPGRMAAGVLTGIGFVGGGAIVRDAGSVRGVTTAAVLWYATVLGLIFGSGHLTLGLAGWVLAMAALLILPHLENHLPSSHYAKVTIVMELEGQTIEEIKRRVAHGGVVLEHLTFDCDLQTRQKTVSYQLRVRHGEEEQVTLDVTNDLIKCPGVLRVTWD